jgi:hypothetical protein
VQRKDRGNVMEKVDAVRRMRDYEQVLKTIARGREGAANLPLNRHVAQLAARVTLSKHKVTWWPEDPTKSASGRRP